MRYRTMVAALLATLLIACASSGPTAPCDLLVRPVLVGKLTSRDSAGRIIHVDSIYSNVSALADTFRVCGDDTTKISKAARKFPDAMLSPVAP